MEIFEKFGSLIGDIIKPYPEPMIARLTSLEKKAYSKDVFVNSNSSFKINKVPEGIYSLMFYFDLDYNNKYFLANSVLTSPQNGLRVYLIQFQ